MYMFMQVVIGYGWKNANDWSVVSVIKKRRVM